MMKKILYIICLLPIIYLNVGCSSEDDIETSIVVETNISTSPLKSEGLITLTTSDFTAKSENDWCVISVDNNTIKVALDNNNSASNRSTIITIMHGGKPTIVPITQLGLLFEFPSADPVLIYSLHGGQKSFRLVTNVPFEIVPSHAWITYVVDEKTKTVVVTVPESDEIRYGSLTLKYAGAEMVLPVDQVVVMEPYEILGAAKMEYTDKTGTKFDVDVKFSLYDGVVAEDEKNKNLLWLEGSFPIVGNLKIKMEYNPDERTLSMMSAQVLNAYTDPSKPRVHFLSIDFYDNNGVSGSGEGANGGIYTLTTRAKYSAESVFMGDDRFVIAFKDNKSWFAKHPLLSTEFQKYINGIVIKGRAGTNIYDSDYNIIGVKHEITGSNSVADYLFINDPIITKKVGE